MIGQRRSRDHLHVIGCRFQDNQLTWRSPAHCNIPRLVSRDFLNHCHLLARCIWIIRSCLNAEIIECDFNGLTLFRVNIPRCMVGPAFVWVVNTVKEISTVGVVMGCGSRFGDTLWIRLRNWKLDGKGLIGECSLLVGKMANPGQTVPGHNGPDLGNIGQSWPGTFWPETKMACVGTRKTYNIETTVFIDDNIQSGFFDHINFWNLISKRLLWKKRWVLNTL